MTSIIGSQILSGTYIGSLIFKFLLNLTMQEFRLDRTKFKAQTMLDAANHGAYYKDLSWQERLSISAYLNSIAFNYDPQHPPRMDRTKFSAKSLKG